MSLQSLMLILTGVLTAGLCCLVAWTTWQMWRTNKPPREAKNPRYRAVLASFGVFYLGLAAAAIPFGWAGVLALAALPLAIAALLHVVTLANVPRRIRTSPERRPPGGPRDLD